MVRNSSWRTAFFCAVFPHHTAAQLSHSPKGSHSWNSNIHTATSATWVPPGAHKKRMLIVNGRDAPKIVPWMVLLKYGAATILSETTILTAAHFDVKPGDVALAGFLSIRSPGPKQQKTKIVECFADDSRPFVEKRNYDHDVRLCTVSPSWDFSDGTLAPAALPTEPMAFYANRPLVSTGWGLVRGQSKNYADKLQEATFSYKAGRRIEDAPGYFVQAKDLFATTSANGAQTCNGDSGGPLVVQGTNIVVGVVSFGDIPCVFSSAFAEVQMWTKWIKEKLGNDGAAQLDPAVPVSGATSTTTASRRATTARNGSSSPEPNGDSSSIRDEDSASFPKTVKWILVAGGGVLVVACLLAAGVWVSSKGKSELAVEDKRPTNARASAQQSERLQRPRTGGPSRPPQYLHGNGQSRQPRKQGGGQSRRPVPSASVEQGHGRRPQANRN